MSCCKPSLLMIKYWIDSKIFHPNQQDPVNFILFIYLFYLFILIFILNLFDKFGNNIMMFLCQTNSYNSDVLLIIEYLIEHPNTPFTHIHNTNKVTKLFTLFLNIFNFMCLFVCLLVRMVKHC